MTKHIPSPNFDARAGSVPLAYIVLHYTGMKDAAAAFARLCDPAAKVSAHYVVGEDGAVTQLVAEEKRAWHAGASFWRGVTDINSASIGIEIVNPGHEHGYRAFPPAQITAAEGLLRDIVTRRGFDARRCLLAHSDIAPARKEDPGELFPWRALAAQGLGLWPEPAAADEGAAGEAEAARLLGETGYDMRDFAAALRAFQRRFYPEKLGAPLDAGTAARLRALRRIW